MKRDIFVVKKTNIVVLENIVTPFIQKNMVSLITDEILIMDENFISILVENITIMSKLN